MHADGSYGRNALDKNGNNGPRREESLPGSKKDGGASDLLAESSGRQRKGVCRGEEELDWSNLSNFYFCPYLSISPTSPTLPRYESCYILFFVFIRKRLATSVRDPFVWTERQCADPTSLVSLFTTFASYPTLSIWTRKIPKRRLGTRIALH